LLVPSEKVIDASTFIERIKIEIHRDRTVDEDAIKRAMCSALEWYKTHRFWFNTDTFKMLTVEDQQDYAREGTTGVEAGYGFPADLVRLDNLRVTVNSSKYPLLRKNWIFLRSLDTSTNISGYPEFYAIHDEKIHIYPRPNATDLVIDGDYVKDVGTPRCVYSSGEWVLKDEDGNTTGLTWTSPMLQYCEELIRHRTKADLYANYIIDIERSNACRMQEHEALDHLQVRSDWLTDPGHPMPWY
jgi:hypothetical protein